MRRLPIPRDGTDGTGAIEILLKVRNAVAVEVTRAVAFQRSEVLKLPAIVHSIAIRIPDRIDAYKGLPGTRERTVCSLVNHLISA